jgi:hypothetical protein
VTPNAGTIDITQVSSGTRYNQQDYHGEVQTPDLTVRRQTSHFQFYSDAHDAMHMNLITEAFSKGAKGGLNLMRYVLSKGVKGSV